MKTKSILSILTALAVAFIFASCSGPKKEETADEHETHESTSSDSVSTASAPLFEVDKTFQSQLAHVLDSYLKVKDAFVASDAAAVKQNAAQLKAVLKAVDPGMLSGPALNDWANYSNSIDMALAEMIGSTDIEVQRTHSAPCLITCTKASRPTDWVAQPRTMNIVRWLSMTKAHTG